MTKPTLLKIYFSGQTIAKISLKGCDLMKNLKLLRNQKGLSQQKLGEIIGATCSAVSYWEKGINEPKLSYIINLAKLFEVSSDYLLGLED